MQINIAGWYGHGNTGDELILDGVVRGLSTHLPTAKMVVHSDSPAETQAQHGIESVWNLPWGLRNCAVVAVRHRLTWHSLHSFRKADLFVLGGGGFLSDWQPESPGYWLSKVQLAKQTGKVTATYAIGAGPFLTASGRRRVKRGLSYVDVVTVRDSESAEWIRECGYQGTIHVTADPAIAWANRIATTHGVPSVAFCPAPVDRGSWERREKQISVLAETARNLAHEGIVVHLISMHPSVDYSLCKEIQQRSGFSEPQVVCHRPANPDVVRSVISTVDVVVGARFHSLVLAANHGIPVIALVYHQKSEQLMRSLDLTEYTFPFGDGVNWRETDVDPRALLDMIHRALECAPKLQGLLCERVRELEARSLLTASLIADSVHELGGTRGK